MYKYRILWDTLAVSVAQRLVVSTGERVVVSSNPVPKLRLLCDELLQRSVRQAVATSRAAGSACEWVWASSSFGKICFVVLALS